jgi:excisionase family DNA binding protein
MADMVGEGTPMTTQTPAANHADPAGSRIALLTPDEVAALLRTSRKAVYAMVERGQLPGVVRIGRRVLVLEADLVQWLRQNTQAIAGKD